MLIDCAPQSDPQETPSNGDAVNTSLRECRLWERGAARRGPHTQHTSSRLLGQNSPRRRSPVRAPSSAVVPQTTDDGNAAAILRRQKEPLVARVRPRPVRCLGTIATGRAATMRGASATPEEPRQEKPHRGKIYPRTSPSCAPYQGTSTQGTLTPGTPWRGAPWRGTSTGGTP